MLGASALVLALSTGVAQAEVHTDASLNARALAEVARDPWVAHVLRAGYADLMAGRFKLELGANTDFRARSALLDELDQVHVRFDQLYRGIPVWEGEVIVHSNPRGFELTNALRTGIQIGITPSLSAQRVLELVHQDLKPQGPYATAPSVELVVFPVTRTQVRADAPVRPGGLNAIDMEQVLVRYALAYHVHTELENGRAETRHSDYLIDANTGRTLKQWDSLETAATTGTGNSQYSGSVQLNVNSITGGYELRDAASTMKYVTYNLNHATSGTGSIFTDTDNTWGDSANYVEGSSTTAANGQTAGVDAHFGVGKTSAYYLNVHGRNGIDGVGSATYSRVHYSNSYDNAFWSDSCFCMTYGDGSSFLTLTSMDVAGHEMTHGVTSRTSNLTYSGESGGLNEAMSDIHGTMVEFYARGGSGSTIGSVGGNWTVGEQLYSVPLRYMFKPSKDGSSPDAWSSSLGSLDVHYSSGPLNRAFYFLSQGASNVSTSDFYSSFLPAGMTGIGNDKAARIAFRALTVKMTASTNYASARTAFEAAATDLYGATSAEYTAVQNAFAAINVGTAPGSGGGGGGGGGSTSNLLGNAGFEGGTTVTPWVQTTGVIDSTSGYSRTGSWFAWMCGYGSSHTDTLYQQVTIPSTATAATLSLYLRIVSSETGSTAYDTLKVQVRNTSNTVLGTLATFSNLNKTTYANYTQLSYNLLAYKGQTVRIYFLASEDSSVQSSFMIDDTSLSVQ